MPCCVYDVSENDRFGDRPNMFQVGLLNACCGHPGCCLYGYFCSPCAAITMRRRVLQYDMSSYSCCQNYFANYPCMREGCGSDNPNCCLCLEAFCCLPCSMSASRFRLQETFQLRSDPCDQRIICCQQICALLGCVCSIIGICCEGADTLGAIFTCCADCMFLSIMGCMSAQMQVEMDHHQYLVPVDQRVIVTVEPGAQPPPRHAVQGKPHVTHEPKMAPPAYVVDK